MPRYTGTSAVVSQRAPYETRSCKRIVEVKLESGLETGSLDVVTAEQDVKPAVKRKVKVETLQPVIAAEETAVAPWAAFAEQAKVEDPETAWRASSEAACRQMGYRGCGYYVWMSAFDALAFFGVRRSHDPRLGLLQLVPRRSPTISLSSTCVATRYTTRRSPRGSTMCTRPGCARLAATVHNS
jgi:hypothetical protein